MEDAKAAEAAIKVPHAPSPDDSPHGSAAGGAGGGWLRSTKSRWAAGIVAALAIVGLALGLGLGLGLPAKNKDNSGSIARGMALGSLSVDRSLPTLHIAADPLQWAYAPSGGDNCLDPGLAAIQPPVHEPPSATGGTFLKGQYRQYTDDSFTTLVERPEDQKHLGILGPLIRAEAGSTIQIMFLNNLPHAVNMEPAGGLTWTEMAPGFLPPVQPGETAVYRWKVPEDAAPADATTTDGTQDSRLYLYHSSVDPTAHDNMGLVGPIIVTAKGRANADGTTKGVDRDIVTLYQVVNENFSPYVFDNAKTVPSDVITTKMAVNGYTYCNLPGLDMTQGERVRWHTAALGSQLSTHSYHWHGNTFLYNGYRVDHVNLLGTNTASLDMTADAPGSWLFHCHLAGHMAQGMMAVYTVKPGSGAAAAPVTLPGPTRTYYVQAEEVMWNYAPQDGLLCSGTKEPFDEDALVFLGPPDDAAKRIGSVYEKAVYVQYTDDTFTKPVARAATDEYMGLLGPVMRANVGDTIKVVFRNKLRYYVSMHPHGVLYDKGSEGAPYKDGSTKHGDDLVKPNTTYTYTWQVPERSGPGPADPSSIVWLYHSHTDESADTSAGLVGVLVINRAGAAPATGTSADGVGAPLASDVDQEAFFFFNVMDETASRYTDDNIKRALGKALWETEDAIEELEEDETFGESSLKHMINGFMFCNGPRAKFTAFERVRFHVVALGSQEDVHSPTVGGGTFMTLGQHGSSQVQLAGSMKSTDVVFTEAGTFNIACRVADHVMSGMEALYDVVQPAQPPVQVTGGATRSFFLSAEKVTWDYAPQGYKQCTNEDQSASAKFLLTPGTDRIGSRRAKALFVQYTDATWATKSDRPAHFGLLGPVMGAEVGDVLEVTLKNNLDFPVNFAPDGGFVSLHNASMGKEVAPGATFVYRFLVPQQAGPLPGDLSTTSLLYLSDIDIPAHTSAGLLGVMVIAAKGGLKADGLTPTDADMLLPLHFQVFNENMSPLYEEQLSAVNPAFQEFVNEDDNMMASINGFMYCNLPPPEVPLGSKIRVIFSAFGSEEAMFSPRILGQSVVLGAQGAVSSAQLLAAISVPADVQTLSPGLWPVLDDIHEHQDLGMVGRINVAQGGSGGIASTASSGSGRKMMLRSA